MTPIQRDCRTIVQQLVSSIQPKRPANSLYKQKQQVKGTQRETVTFEDQDLWGEEVEQNLGQKNLSGEKVVDEDRRNYQQDPGQENFSGEPGVEENVQGEKQHLQGKTLSGEFKWMSREHKSDPEEETCSATDCFVDDNSRNSGSDTYSDRNSNTGSELS